jgi:hypothetical protein
MLTALYKSLTVLLLLTLCMTALTVALRGSPQSPTQGLRQPTPSAPAYFPAGETDASIFSPILASLCEPSLSEAAKDPSILSFRASFFSPVPTRELTVRLVVNVDGGGQIKSSVSAGAATGIKRTQTSVSAEDVDKFLQLAEKAGFWSMSSTDDTKQKTDSAGRKVHVMDGALWMMEGVRRGSFHYVYRRNPNPNPILAIECYLTKDLSKQDDPAFSMPRCAPRGK